MSKKIIIFRSSLTNCWDGDLDTGVENINDAELSRIADYGYNGIWIHQPLRDYTPSLVFPEFGKKSDQHLRLLDQLSRRADRYGIRVYMYLLEPRAMLSDDPFWEVYPELRGQHFLQPGFERHYDALCSSQPRVREYIYDSLQKISSRIDLSFYAITAAEDFNTCIGKLVGKEQAQKIHCTYPHGIMIENNCPLCSKRTGAETIAELLNTMYEGISSGNPNADLIAWDWGWRKLPWKDTEKNILDSLHQNIIYISDFEIGGTRGFTKKHGIYEYSLGYVGPSESFSKWVSYAGDRGRRVGAKMQVGTTHEIATVPNLPLIHNLWEKVNRSQKLGASVAFATWSIGTYQTLNTYLFGHAFQSEDEVSWPKFLGMACSYLSVPLKVAPDLEKAWNCFERALEYFPYSVPMLYHGPVNYAAAYWLPPRQTQGTPMGMCCYLVDRGDDLDFCCGDYSLAEVVEHYEKLRALWCEGLKYMDHVKLVLHVPSKNFIQEYDNAKCILHVYQSVCNVFKAYQICRCWEDSMMPGYLALCEEELKNCQELLPLLKQDPRLGMHLECNGYMFNFDLVSEKIKCLEHYLASESVMRNFQ